MTGFWYIDALDARAGRAFATLRPANLLNSETLDDGDATFFIGPPDFEPEPVASRAVALSAARRGFQEGLLDEEGEIPFRDLAAVTEFVRRAYVRGAGGDGGGDGGEAGPAEGRPPPPDLPPFGGEEGGGDRDGHSGGDPALRFGQFIATCQEASDWLGRGEYLLVYDKYQEPGQPGEAKAVERLARGALRVALENLADEGPPGLAASAARLGTMAALGRSIRTAGLSGPIRDVIGADGKVADWLAQRTHGEDGMLAYEALIQILFGGEIFLPDGRYAWPLLHAGEDPVTLLFKLKAPVAFSRFAAGACRPDQVSIGHLLFSILGAPQMSLSGCEVDLDLYEILLFASASIVQRSIEPQLPPLWQIEAMRFARASLTAFHAERWLRRNIAWKVFAPGVEALIEKAAELSLARLGERETARA